MPRLVQSRASSAAFYVKDVSKDMVTKVSEATGIEDIQAHPGF